MRRLHSINGGGAVFNRVFLGYLCFLGLSMFSYVFLGFPMFLLVSLIFSPSPNNGEG